MIKWEYVPSTEHHGPYVVTEFGSTVCDFYTMTDPGKLSTRNGGTSTPVHFLGDEADDNARLVAEAPVMAEALRDAVNRFDRKRYADDSLFEDMYEPISAARAILARIESRST